MLMGGLPFPNRKGKVGWVMGTERDARKGLEGVEGGKTATGM